MHLPGEGEREGGKTNWMLSDTREKGRAEIRPSIVTLTPALLLYTQKKIEGK